MLLNTFKYSFIKAFVYFLYFRSFILTKKETMAPRRAEEVPMKSRKAAFGCRLPSRLPPGEILTDITQNSWRLGDAIGCGGFGDVYLGKSL